MMEFATACMLVLFACMIPCLYRIAVGPHVFDRLLAFDLVGVLLAAALAVHAVVQRAWVYLEISMGLAVLALVGTVAVAHFVDRERVF
jgi:multisubunit Na+/H+ antiporter MnhF subunit